MMRCLVTNIPFSIQSLLAESSQESEPTKATSQSSSYTAYELARLRSLLRHCGHEVLAVDLSRYKRGQVERLLRDFTPAVVIVDAASFQDHSERHSLLEYFLLVKSICHETRTVWGGRDASALATFALTHSMVVDVVLCDESDSTLPRLLQVWEQGSHFHLDGLPGIAFRSNGELYRGRKLLPHELVPLDKLPFLDYQGLELEQGDWPIVMSSRGCPYSCRFCYRQYRIHRCHSVEYFAEHLCYLRERYGHKQFRIDDELFTLDRQRCLAICEELARRSLAIEFDCFSRVNTFDRKLAVALKRAGCRMVWFGVESGCDQMLARMRKGQTVAETARAVAVARHAGLKVCCNVLIGYPGETRQSLLRTFLMLRQLSPDSLSVQRLRVMPGTELFDYCEREGVLDEEAWILSESNFCYERDFSREALDVVVKFLEQMSGHELLALDKDLAKYIVMKASKPVCLCRAVGEEELRFAVNSGVTSLGALKQRTGAMSGCGKCVNYIATLLHVWQKYSSEGGQE